MAIRNGEIIGKSFSNFYTEEDRKNNLPQKLLEQARQTGRARQEGWRWFVNTEAFFGQVWLILHSNTMKKMR